ncbi:MAG: FdtA/QdtA family cupin domain-containing protein [Gammaproteobacteria bacterium]|nr:FdtA/QdtA family cupin domain-containing protein [Gammaproteobacteria bacterium]MBU1776204.1 FdtA/QdtA family cupin domain-containing protein [Gammaproteobacteria bacterium]
MPLEDCKSIALQKISDTRGNLSIIEGGNHIPFDKIGYDCIPA